MLSINENPRDNCTTTIDKKMYFKYMSSQFMLLVYCYMVVIMSLICIQYEPVTVLKFEFHTSNKLKYIIRLAFFSSSSLFNPERKLLIHVFQPSTSRMLDTMLFTWGFFTFIHAVVGYEITRDELPEWLTSRSIEELSNAYHNLDYNHDGYVSFGELKLGIVSMCDHQIVKNRFARDMENVQNSHEISIHTDYLSLESTQEQFKSWFTYKPESFSCVPSLDPVCNHILYIYASGVPICFM